MNKQKKAGISQMLARAISIWSLKSINIKCQRDIYWCLKTPLKKIQATLKLPFLIHMI
jgi:hypothetical protein